MQLAISYVPREREDLWTQQRRWVRNAVDLLGHKFVAAELDIGPSQLTDALLERERKDIKARWIVKLLELVPEPLKREWHRIALDATGYEPDVKLKQVKSSDEILNDVGDKIGERFGEAGRQFWAEVMGR